MTYRALVRNLLLSLLFTSSLPAFAAGSITIKKSTYQPSSKLLTVSGTIQGFSGKQDVELHGGSPLALLASENTRKNFTLNLKKIAGQAVPCIVQVTAGDVSVQAEVGNAPTNCSQPNALVLSGVVRDNPIPFAAITITVGGLTYTTVADENGEFLVEIGSFDLAALVLIESLGENPSDETKTVDMTSLAGTFSKLVEDADGDGIVDGTENPNINNTPYTTALFVLLAQANGGEPPATLGELQAAEKTVDATEILQLAAVIKLIVDDPDFELPIDASTGEPYTSILSFLADPAVDGDGNTPVDNFIADNTEAVNEAVQIILDDADIVQGFVEADIPARYYELVPTQVGFISRQGGALLFEHGPNVGETRQTSDGGPLPGAFEWQVTSGQLAIEFTVQPAETYFVGHPADPITAPLRCREPDDPQFDACPYTCAEYADAYDRQTTDVLATATELERTYTRYAESPGGTREFASLASLVQTDYQPFEFDHDNNPGTDPLTFEFCDEFEVVKGNRELLNAATNPPKRLEVNEFANETLAIYVNYDPDDGGPNGTGLFLDFVTLDNGAADGDGYRSATTLLSGTSLDWRITHEGGDPEDTNDNGIADGDALQFRYAGGVLQSMQQLDPSVGLETGMFFEVTGVPDPYGIYDIFLRVDPAFAFSEPYLTNNTGEYWQGTINSWYKGNWVINQDGDFELGPFQAFGWEFLSGGSGNNLTSGGPVPMHSWQLLPADTQVFGGELEALPAGTLDIHYHNQHRHRFWVPIDDTLVDVPENIADAPAVRQRFYSLEVEYVGNTGAMRIPPRINSQEIFFKSIFP